MGASVKSGLHGIAALLCVVVAAAAFFSGCGKSPDAMYREGKALVGKTETQAQGMAVLEKFVKKFPKDSRAPEVMLAIANIHLNAKQYPEAEAAYNRLIEKYPKSAEAYNGLFILGYMYFDGMKDNAKAKAVFNKFIAAYPDSGLTVSAREILKNIDLPLEQWSTVKNIMTEQNADSAKAAVNTADGKQ